MIYRYNHNTASHVKLGKLPPDDARVSSGWTALEKWNKPSCLSRDERVLKAMAKANPVLFQQVLSEGRKVSWATRSQAVTTTIMVVVFVSLASLYFLAADFIARTGVGFLLGLGR